MTTVDDVHRAAAAIAGRILDTPVLPCEELGAGVGLKAELFQRSGSFKLRGATNRMLALTADERARGVITVSAGNHAAAVAYAARETGTDALVLMPRGASTAKVERTRSYGGTVDLESVDGAEAFARMTAIAADTGRTVVHPFDDPLVMAGAGTIGLEIVAAVPDVDCVIVPVGGGGLIGGIALAVKATRPDCRIIGVQPEATATLRTSLAAGHPVPRRHDPTIADALTPPSVGAGPLAVLAALLDDVVHLTEEEIATGMRFAYETAKLACEPAAATPIGALLAGRVAPGAATVLVISGGNVSPEVVARVLAG
jgi:threonine dehydratase